RCDHPPREDFDARPPGVLPEPARASSRPGRRYPLLSADGEWIRLSTRPWPRNMCTPHGRQGSKLRTERMMSMPLNLSGAFSSKMGVFWTASSYGPGVPYMSRAFPFHGGGGYGW